MKTGMATIVVMTLIVGTMVMPAWAQAPTQSTQNLEVLAMVGAQMGANMRALKGYTFQQRTAAQVNGELKNVKLVQVAFTPQGETLVTTLSSEPPEQLHGGPFMRHIEEDKAKEMKGEIEQVVALSNSYLMLDQQGLQQLGRMAQAWMSPDGSTIRVTASGFQQPGDQVTITCDGATKRQLQTQVNTTIFGGPMTINAQYQQWPSGLNYNAQTVINVPGKSMQITINTMNYIKQ
ncbi:MAG TPA: hypothetical protein VKF36_16310 [Syntrophorhabdales bacterium]|nr:hypothetical protein [Syntrophorhabdales bacterium]